MTSTLADAASLASAYADRLLVGTTRDVHRAVSRRVLTATRQQRSPVGAIHEGVTAAVYGAVSLATRGLGQVGRLGILGTDLEASPRSRRTRSIVNGLVGDALHDRAHPVAVPAAVRSGGVDVALRPSELGRAFPTATSRVVVFVHGLCEDDEGWAYRSDTRPSYLDALTGDTTWTPVAVRYNSGRSVHDSAATLTQLIDGLVDAWPLEVTEIALVGHSMGGLVARAAAQHAEPAWWSDRVSHVVLLGCPHSGASLERIVDVAVPAMGRWAEAAPFGSILDERSAGIRDLRHGIGVDRVVWPSAAYHCVAATLGAGPRHLLGRVFGDLLVSLDSARGAGAGLDADLLRVPGAHHFDLLNHPDVYAALRRWLDPAAEAEIA